MVKKEKKQVPDWLISSPWLDQIMNSIVAAKDLDTSFFRKMDRFQPCELTELKAFTVLAQSTEMMSRYTDDIQAIDELLKQRNEIYALDINAPLKRNTNLDIVHNIAQIAHCITQGKVGSGFGVSSTMYGSQQHVRFSPDVISSSQVAAKSVPLPEVIIEIINGK
ncbi:hypothetical protein RJT34_20044 [Clitoria ternatea]|uniref:Uncharacterized protein n=1 Tax=Clitoria ternatea TaxID=43366 RepID=A0AAN9ISM1_CLITE